MEGDSGKRHPKLPLCDAEEKVEGDGDAPSPTPDNQCRPGALEVQDYLGQTSMCAGLCTCVCSYRGTMAGNRQLSGTGAWPGHHLIPEEGRFLFLSVPTQAENISFQLLLEKLTVSHPKG